MTSRFQIGTFGLDVLCLERAVLEFQITIEQLGDFAGRALAQRSPYKPTHLRSKGVVANSSTGLTTRIIGFTV